MNKSNQYISQAIILKLTDKLIDFAYIIQFIIHYSVNHHSIVYLILFLCSYCIFFVIILYFEERLFECYI